MSILIVSDDKERISIVRGAISEFEYLSILECDNEFCAEEQVAKNKNITMILLNGELLKGSFSLIKKIKELNQSISIFLFLNNISMNLDDCISIGADYYFPRKNEILPELLKAMRQIEQSSY